MIKDRALITFSQSGVLGEALSLLDSARILYHTNGCENRGVVVSVDDLCEVENLLTSNGFSCTSKELVGTVCFVLKPTYDKPRILSQATGILIRSEIEHWVLSRLCLCVDEHKRGAVEILFNRSSIPFEIE